MRDADLADTVDAYCERLRGAFWSVPAARREDFVQEIRSHALERARELRPLTPAGLTKILEALGDPRELAADYELEVALGRAAESRSPWVLLRTTLSWARTGIAGFAALVLTAVGYGSALVFYLCALLEPFFPSQFGLWQGAGSRLTFGFWSGQPGAEAYGIGVQPPGSFVLGTLGPAAGPMRDVLGLWIVPLGLVLGAAAGVATTLLTRALIRRFRSTAEPARRLSALG